MSLLDEGDGRSRLVMDDVRSEGAANPMTWEFHAFFTQKTLDNKCLDSMTLTDDEYRDIGIAVIARLLAVNGRSK